MSWRDRITLSGVRATGYHGVLDHERRDGQEFVVDVEMGVDLGPAGASDALEDTVNYAAVAASIVDVVTGPPHDLIETVAALIADRILGEDLVHTVRVTVHKPQAPVGVPFTDVAVSIERRRSVPVVIALGANLSEPEDAVARALRRLKRLRGLHEVRGSALYRTDPVGGPEQPEFVNAVALARTSLSAPALLAALHGLEDQFGRVRDVRWGPRTLDLDLIQYGTPGQSDERLSRASELALPHPRAYERGFVLIPWSEVDPDARLRLGPDGGADIAPVADLVAALTERNDPDAPAVQQIGDGSPR